MERRFSCHIHDHCWKSLGSGNVSELWILWTGISSSWLLHVYFFCIWRNMHTPFLFPLPWSSWYSPSSIWYLLIQGGGAGLFVPEWRNTSAMGKWLQDNIYGCHYWPSSLHTKCTKTKNGGWNSRNPAYLCLPKHPCKGRYPCKLPRSHFLFWNSKFHSALCYSVLQEKWSKNLYIASICYGRTVC